MKGIALFIFILISVSAFGQGNKGFIRPEYIGHPSDSDQISLLAWNPDQMKAVWMDIGTSGGNDSVFVDGDSICVISGDTVCVSQDSFYITTDSLCVISEGDTLCVPFGSTGVNVYNSDGLVTDVTRRVSIPYNSNFYLQRKENGSGNHSYLWIQPDNNSTFINMSQLAASHGQAVLEMTNLSSGSIFQKFNGFGANEDYSFGVNTTSNALVISEGQDLFDPYLSIYSAGDSIVIQNDTISSGPALRIRSHSTAAASNSQKLLEVDLKGVNGTALQTTYAGYFSNAHTGSGHTNVGIYSTITGANAGSSAIVGNSTSLGTAVQGIAASGFALYGLSAAGTSVYGLTNGSSSVFAVKAEKSNTNSGNTEPVLGVFANSTNTTTSGFGGSIAFYNETDNGTSREANKIESEWTTVADATRVSRMTITGASSATIPDIVFFNGNKTTQFQGAMQTKQGTNIASGSSLTLSI